MPVSLEKKIEGLNPRGLCKNGWAFHFTYMAEGPKFQRPRKKITDFAPVDSIYDSVPTVALLSSFAGQDDLCMDDGEFAREIEFAPSLAGTKQQSLLYSAIYAQFSAPRFLVDGLRPDIAFQTPRLRHEDMPGYIIGAACQDESERNEVYCKFGYRLALCAKYKIGPVQDFVPSLTLDHPVMRFIFSDSNELFFELAGQPMDAAFLYYGREHKGPLRDRCAQAVDSLKGLTEKISQAIDAEGTLHEMVSDIHFIVYRSSEQVMKSATYLSDVREGPYWLNIFFYNRLLFGPFRKPELAVSMYQDSPRLLEHIYVSLLNSAPVSLTEYNLPPLVETAKDRPPQLLYKRGFPLGLARR